MVGLAVEADGDAAGGGPVVEVGVGALGAELACGFDGGGSELLQLAERGLGAVGSGVDGDFQGVERGGRQFGGVAQVVGVARLAEKE